MLLFFGQIPGADPGRVKLGNGCPFFKELLLQTGMLQQHTKCIAVIKKHWGRSFLFLVLFGSQIFDAFLTSFGLCHFGVFKCNFNRFLCGKELSLHKICVISMFISGRMHIVKL